MSPTAKKPESTKSSVSLSKSLVSDWQSAALAMGKFPRGTSRDLPAYKKIRRLVDYNKKFIEEIWESFTSERSKITTKMLSDRKYAVSYLLGFHLANIARWQLLWDRMGYRYDLSTLSSRPFNIYDLGCGTGASSQFLRSTLHDKSTAHLYDNTGMLLDIARKVLSNSPDTCLKTSKTSLDQLKSSFFSSSDPSVFALSYVWNELQKNKKARNFILKTLASAATKDRESLVVLLEPGNQYPARDAMELRDELVSAGYVALYPCPHSLQCPMLEKSRDWCYSTGEWERPAVVEHVDKLLDISRDTIHTAGYVLATRSLAEKLAPKKEIKSTLVGTPLDRTNKGPKPKYQWLLCESKGKLTRRPAGKRPVKRGDLVT